MQRGLILLHKEGLRSRSLRLLPSFRVLPDPNIFRVKMAGTLVADFSLQKAATVATFRKVATFNKRIYLTYCSQILKKVATF